MIKARTHPTSRWEWAEAGNCAWAFHASESSEGITTHCRIYEAGDGYEAEAEVQFESGNSTAIRGGGVETAEEAQKTAEIIGDWLVVLHHPLEEGTCRSRYPFLWNRAVVEKLLSPPGGAS